MSAAVSRQTLITVARLQQTLNTDAVLLQTVVTAPGLQQTLMTTTMILL